MALPPTIPTSFVPKRPVDTSVRHTKSGVNAFMIIAIAIAGLAILGAVAVFGYKLYLEGTRDAKAAELLAAQSAIDVDAVEEFVRLRNRLQAADTLLDQHVHLSAFFDVLETRTLQTVRFSTLSVTVKEDRSAEVEVEGVARSFNALAAQSTQLAAEKRIRRAIFSNITVNENGTVSFTLTAELDTRLITSTTDVLSGPALPVVEESAPAITEPLTPAAETPEAEAIAPQAP